MWRLLLPLSTVLAIGARDRASSRLRVWDHLDWLRTSGVEVHADSLVPAGATSFSPAVLTRLLSRLPGWVAAFLRADAVMIQESLLLWPLVLVRRVGKRRTVLFDFSDPVDRHGSGLKGWLRRRAFGLLVRHADAVMVENRAYLERLGDRARRLIHFYGPVNAARYRDARMTLGVLPVEGAVRIGWPGSPGTFRFIAPLLSNIDEIACHHPIEVVLIGAGSIDTPLKHARLTLIDWNEDTEFATVPTFDLGLFRLEDSEDALWRGAGKLFIYMAAGVPFVASERGIARDLMREAGVGFPVSDDAQWGEVLTRAVADVQLRREMAATSLVQVSSLSYDSFRQALLASLVPAR